ILTRITRTGLQDTALQSVGQRDGVEIDQQTDATAAEAQIGQKLRVEQWLHALDRLQLQHDFIADDDVGDVAAVQHHIVVAYRKRDLPAERYAGTLQLVAEAGLID